MSKSFGILLSLCLLASAPAFAGNLVFENGQTVWHSTQCRKPVPPATSVINANPETAGEGMNALMDQHNAYVAAARDYMNCISNEAESDQKMVIQSITSGAQGEIAQMQADVDSANAPLRRRQP
ncbi:MAG: hypothetical protein P4M13_06240 [Alphaproteobacteria bacterium]|nr:hypothetical protein [Alphaproteobacteria bacterium]